MLGIVIFLALLSLYQYTQSESGKRKVDHLKLKTPGNPGFEYKNLDSKVFQKSVNPVVKWRTYLDSIEEYSRNHQQPDCS